MSAVSIASMSDVSDSSGAEIVRGAEEALAHPADVDLDLLSAVRKGLSSVSSGTGGGLPVQRPPHVGEEGLAARHPR
jgi:hypothetical protein